MDFWEVVLRIFGYGKPGFLVVSIFILGVGACTLCWLTDNAPLGDKLKWFGKMGMSVAQYIAMYWTFGAFIMALSVAVMLVGIKMVVPELLRPW